jgi:hypothetical protein
MAEKLGFDLPAGFAYKAVTDVVMNDECFENAHNMLMRSNQLLAIGEETVRRAAASSSPDSHQYFGLGARLYAITFGYAEPEKANSNMFNSAEGSDVARNAGKELLVAESKGGFYKHADHSLGTMQHHSPVLAEFLQRLAETLTTGDQNSKKHVQAIMYGAALMRSVHIRGKTVS